MKKGLALIVVIGILGILAVLAVAFVLMAQLERRASEQRVNAARAYLLARSGIEDALARMGGGQDPSAAESRYGGEDWQMDGDQGPGSFDRQQEVYRRGELNVADCPARQALRPSFFTRDALGRPALLPVDGRQRGYSGALSGDEALAGNTYVLKAGAEGSEGQGFYINGGDPSFISNPTQTSDYNTNLRRMLGILARAIQEDVAGAAGGLSPGSGVGDVQGVAGGLILTESDGWALIDNRPSTGWKDWKQVRDLAWGGVSGVSDLKLAALKPYLTLHAWTDKKLIAPNVAAAMIEPNGTDWSFTGAVPAKHYPSWGEFKLDHPETGQGSRAPSFERIKGRIVGRAPVDLSWARRRRPALITLLANLKGLHIDENTADYGYIGTLRVAEVSLVWKPDDICHKVADQILSSTSDLMTWQQWNDFCDALPDDAVASTQDQGINIVEKNVWLYRPEPTLRLKRQAVRDLLKANFNPNSNLNKFNPNRSLWRSVDKGDLLVYSTEFSLLPVPYGRQEMESVGRVVDRRGSLRAIRGLKAGVVNPPLVRLTTQKEFMCGELGSTAVSGDEGGLRLPGRSEPFINRNQGLGKTWGHSLPGLGGQGVSLQAYPEPCVDDGHGLSINSADYDGSIQLATMETASDDCYGVATDVRDMKMLARYATGFDLDVADAFPSNPDGNRNHPDVQQVSYRGDWDPPDISELRFSVLHVSRPNTLYPDGCYAERGRAPAYLDKGNANGFHGVMSFWAKPCYGMAGHSYVRWTNFRSGTPDPNDADQFFFLGKDKYSGDYPGGRGMTCCHFEVGQDTNDVDREHNFNTESPVISHRWQCITMYWDFLSSLANNTGRLVVDTEIVRGSSYGGWISNAPDAAADITQDDLFGLHRIGLGRGRPEAEPPAADYAADATFDEFVLYDFGGAGPGGVPDALDGTMASPEVLASNRYLEGRYYKESAYFGLGDSRNTAGEWFSAPISLGAVHIRGLAWTQIVPPELRPHAAISFELVNEAGTAYALDLGGNQLLTNPAFSPVNRSLRGAFRLHAVFQPNLADPENTPILDPLALDDVTVYHEPLSGPRVLTWEASDAD